MVITRPITDTIAETFFMSKALKLIMVPFEFVTIPALLRPIKAIKSPIPTATAFFMEEGIDFIMASLTPKKERTIKSTPSKRTAVRANQGEQPI